LAFGREELLGLAASVTGVLGLGYLGIQLFSRGLT
jgi:hypothetical protein